MRLQDIAKSNQRTIGGDLRGNSQTAVSHIRTALKDIEAA